MRIADPLVALGLKTAGSLSGLGPADPFAYYASGYDSNGGYHGTYGYVEVSLVEQELASSFYPQARFPFTSIGKQSVFQSINESAARRTVTQSFNQPSGARNLDRLNLLRSPDLLAAQDGVFFIMPQDESATPLISSSGLTPADSSVVSYGTFRRGDQEYAIADIDEQRYVYRTLEGDEITVVATLEPGTPTSSKSGPFADPSVNASFDTEPANNRSSAGGREVDQVNSVNAIVQSGIAKGEPIRVPVFNVDRMIRDLAKVLDRHEKERIYAAGLMEAASEAEVRNQEEAALNADLPGGLGAVVPIYGAVQSSRGHLNHGNYGRGALYGALAISDVFLVKSLAVGGGKLASRAIGALFGVVVEKTLPRQLGAVGASNFVHVVRGGGGERGIGVLRIDPSRLTAKGLETTINHVKDADFQAGFAEGLTRSAVKSRSVANSAARLGKKALGLGKAESAGHIPDVAGGGNPLGAISGLPSYANSSIGGQWSRYAPGFIFDGFSLVDRNTGEFLYWSLALEDLPERIVF